MNMNTNKPVFELSDIELKAFAYDTTVEIKRLQKNLDLIDMELERRKNSVVVRMSQEQFNQSLETN
jgi:hypothetical protein